MLRLLLVDDDPAVTARYQRHVSRIAGFAVQGVAHGSEDALRILENVAVDLVVLDQFLTPQTGLELLRHIRHTGLEVDAVMTSTVGEGANVQMALRYGAVDYLVKPFDFLRFKSALEAYGERMALIRSAAPLRQTDIDAHILTQPRREHAELPKGLEHTTLAHVRRAAALRGTPFSTQDLAQELGISRVTIRKYLEFLKEKGMLRSTLSYRSAGRPLSLYSYEDE